MVPFHVFFTLDVHLPHTFPAVMFPSHRFMSNKSGMTISCMSLVLGAAGESLGEYTLSVHSEPGESEWTGVGVGVGL